MTRPNIYYLTVDSLSYPFFKQESEKLRQQISGTEFSQATATASDTNSAMPGLAAGIYSDTVPGWGLKSGQDVGTIASVLDSAGYECGMWSDNYLFSEEYGYGEGFTGGNVGKKSWKKEAISYIRDSPAERLFGLAEWGYFNIFTPLADKLRSTDETLYKTAEQLNIQALNWLSESSDPTFCWVHYMDTHHPYEPPAEYLNHRELNTPRSRGELGQLTREIVKNNGTGYSESELEDVQTAYRACCEYLGDELSDFIASLERDGHFEPGKDIIVISADHGECLSPRETGSMGHVPPAFWETITNVPLIVGAPSWEETHISDQVSLIDLFPTILEIANVEVPESAEGVAAANPEELSKKLAYFASQWGPAGEELSRTYRGVRHSSGAKLFGGHVEDEDRVYATQVADGIEDVVSKSDGTTLPTELPKEFGPLREVLEDHGPLIEYRQNTDPDETVQEHLADLGYLD